MSKFEENESFEEIQGLLSEGPSDISPEQPPAFLWDAIQADIVSEDDTSRSVPLQLVSSEETVAQSGQAASSSTQRRLGVLLSAAAAFLLLMVGAVWLVSSLSDNPTQLVALGASTAEASVSLDNKNLSVETKGLEDIAGSSYEVWLLQVDPEDAENVLGLQSLGMITDKKDFTIPADIDLSVFTVVDISIEPNDENPDHSGNSILRGEMA